MSNTMFYKGYDGSVEYSSEDHCLHGKVLNIISLVSYEGQTIDELENDFREAVDDYLALCEETGRVPEKPFKGSFNVRIGQDLHRELALNALSSGVSLNTMVKTILESYCEAKRTEVKRVG